jgi:hypothetical protein
LSLLISEKETES